MKRGSTLFLRSAVLAVGAAVLALCIFVLPAMWRAVPGEYPNHTYVFYCILLAMYTAAIPFFAALHQTLKLLGYIDKDKAFSDLSVRALRTIKMCAVAISAVYAAAMPFFYIWADNDDAPGLVIIGLALIMAPFAVAVFAAVLQRLLQEAMRIKSENDLTV
jgi:hypothetical protein